MIIGYARVSTADQELRLQSDALQAAGCDKIYTDTSSGATMTRAGLTSALEYAREGDTLMVWKLDRLGRTMKGLIDLAADLEARKIALVSLTDSIDTRTPAGRFFFVVMAALAVMERDLMLERTRAGLAAAKNAGRVGGRRPAMTLEKLDAARKLLDAGTPPKDVAKAVNVSIATLYRHLPAAARSQAQAVAT